jgi:hypothetical protein
LWRWRETRGPWFDAQDEVSTVGDKDVSRRVGRVMYNEEREAAPEERVGRISNLDLLGGGRLV